LSRRGDFDLPWLPTAAIGSQAAACYRFAFFRELESRLNVTSVPFAAGIADHILRRTIAEVILTATALTHVLVDEADSTSPGHALAR
jgi:hypothetical protein